MFEKSAKDETINELKEDEMMLKVHRFKLRAELSTVHAVTIFLSDLYPN